MNALRCAVAAALVSVPLIVNAAEIVRLEDVDYSQINQSYHETRKDMSCTSKPMRIGSKTYEHGLGTCAVTCLQLDLGGNVSEFTGDVGVDFGSTYKDDKTGEDKHWGQAEFIIITEDKNILWRSGVMKGGEEPKSFKVDLTGVKKLRLYVTSPRPDWIDNADWADAKFTVTGDKSAIKSYRDQGVIFTPKASPKPRINGARVFGVRPGSPFIFTIPATGTRPMTFSARGLPKGLVLDSTNGRICGKLDKPGTYNVMLTAKNKLGKDSKPLQIECGDKIALTPPMGWNSYNYLGAGATQQIMQAVADAFVSKDLINHGWTYVNTDFGWNSGDKIDPVSLSLVPDPSKYQDFKAMCDYIHSLGLKVGLYSSPWVHGYSGYLGESAFDAARTQFKGPDGVGPYTFEKEDVAQWVKWGIDYMKYDWAPIDIPNTERMANALQAAPRDIVYSLSNGATLKWAEDYVRLANCWRTTGDIGQNWTSMATIGFDLQDKWRPYAGPGHWNDADMMMIGHKEFSPNEQYTHMSLWCLLTAPLMMGFDVTKADDFLVNLLTNDEVLEVDQDPLGQQAARLVHGGDFEVWAKDMSDGSKAVGLFNRGLVDGESSIKWSDLKISGAWKVRDLWSQKDLGTFNDEITFDVPWHGCKLVRIWKVKG